jgi:hypothetical protein
VPHGIIINEWSNQQTLAANNTDIFSLGNNATLSCQVGYVANNEPTLTKETGVICVTDDIKGAFWAHDNDESKQAMCIRGTKYYYIIVVVTYLNDD